MYHSNRDQIAEEELEAIRSNIAAQRKKKGLTQIELAEKMGVTQRVVSYYENQAKTISLDAIAKIAKALDIPKSRILISNNEPEDLPELPKAFQKKISKIKELSPKSQRAISDVLDTMIKAEGI